MTLPDWWGSDKPYRIVDCIVGMRSLPDNCIDLIVTSPPYNAGKEYEDDLTDKAYYDWVLQITQEWKRILKHDGRFAVNVCFNINRYDKDGNKEVMLPYIQWMNALLDAGLKVKENVVWDQKNSGCETAWGSWKSASSPHVRHMCEYILIGYNEVWKLDRDGESTMNTQEFMRYTIDKWRFNAETHERDHPAPFPVELPNRCIKFLTYKNDIVLDPFIGSGTTLLACRHNDRVGIGFEMNEEYVPIIKKRILETIPRLENWFGDDDDE